MLKATALDLLYCVVNPPVPLTTQIECNGPQTRRPAGHRVLCWAEKVEIESGFPRGIFSLKGDFFGDVSDRIFNQANRYLFANSYKLFINLSVHVTEMIEFRDEA